MIKVYGTTVHSVQDIIREFEETPDGGREAVKFAYELSDPGHGWIQIQVMSWESRLLFAQFMPMWLYERSARPAH
jgi:hypothetical protein